MRTYPLHKLDENNIYIYMRYFGAEQPDKDKKQLKALLEDMHELIDHFNAKMEYKSMYDRKLINQRQLTMLKKAIANQAPKSIDRNLWA